MAKYTKKSAKKKKNKFNLTLLIAFIAIFSLLLFFLKRSNDDLFIPVNSEERSKRDYTIDEFTKGVDISYYQGDVDFNMLYDQGIKFAFIKATEGGSHVDPKFFENYENAKKSNVKVGVYHFFRFEVPIKEQVDNFIKNVKLDSHDLPPVIDLEYYGEYTKNPADTEKVKSDLRYMIDEFYKAYGKNTIIYCNSYVYDRYILGDFKDVDIWYRKIGSEVPEIFDGRQWMVWQYDDHGILEGYGGAGAHKYIDLNYFYGDLADLENYGKTKRK